MSNNLVTNGTFDADSDWTKGAGWSIANGKATQVPTFPGGGNLEQNVDYIDGRRYTLVYTVTDHVAGWLQPQVGGIPGTAVSAVGTYTETFTIAAESWPLRFRVEPEIADLSIDDVSLFAPAVPGPASSGRGAGMSSTAGITQTTLKEDSCAQLMARIGGLGGTLITAASISTLTYAVYDLDNDNVETAGGSLTPGDVIYDTAQTGAHWSRVNPGDTEGYNFLHTVAAAAFPTGGNRYRVEYTFTDTNGNVFDLRFEGIALPKVGS